ncbi:hypothetical protein FSP39_002282 [Pinctada imbricata]|uniref:non-specific serine/threonine protein kinase n=1 Tax=Pinctada imbricata TaxID=66713 RepID=A0AA89C6E7_PINIB|nr:hypothetical protein FSP39_002282 [Pinctada imbricata]
MGNTHSQLKAISCGVPQGSVLGPLLFLIYINDLPLHVKSSSLSLFADDATLHKSAPSVDFVKLPLSSDVDNVNKWCRENDNDDMDTEKLKDAILRDDEDDVVNIVTSAVTAGEFDLNETRYDGLSAIHVLCKDGTASPTILKFLLDHQADVNQQSSEGTPLQIVAKYGTAKYIHILLDYGAFLETADEPVYHERSPFYIASMYGQAEVVRQLFMYQPKLVKQEGVRSNLLYAACIGGNMEIIKQWYCPNMNINDPPYYCTEGFCIDKTALYAACSGGHIEVVKYLVHDLEAETNAMVCEKFPDIISEVLNMEQCFEMVAESDSCDLLEEEENWFKGDFSRRGLGGFHSSWIHTFIMSLVELDISYNQIKTLPQCVPWSLPNLRIFNAAHNQLSKLMIDDLQPVMCQKLEKVQLEHNKLCDLCDELFQLSELHELNISNNNLKYLVKTHQRQEDWKQMTNKKDRSEWNCCRLLKLSVSHNVLEMLPPDIRICRNLTSLDAAHNKLITLPSPWECKLAWLDVSHNLLVRFPPSVEQFWCGTLRVLRIHDNQLEELGESIFKLCVMTELDASNNSIMCLPSPEVWDCRHLYLLNLSNNKLGITFGIQSPTNRAKKFLYKRQHKTSVSVEPATHIAFPSFLAHCLQELYLSDNDLDGIPPTVCDLSSLALLDLSNNPGIKKLPKALGKLSLCNNLKLHGCNEKMLQELKFPVQSASFKERETFSKDVIQKLRNEYRCSKRYHRLKLVILGKKDKGKTTLSSKLGAKLQDEVYSVGVRRSEVVLPCPKRKGSGLRDLLNSSDSNPPLTLSIWDLAGDEAYAATHHCFFTQNSMYLVVWDIWSIVNEIEKLGKLLYSIEASTPNSKVILVATFLDKNTSSARKQEIERVQSELLVRFGSTSEQYAGMCSKLTRDCIIPVSCISGDGIQELKKTLYEEAMKLKDLRHRMPLLGRMVPQSYIAIQHQILIELEAREKLGWPPLLYQQEFTNFVASVEGSDIDVNEELPALVKFLMETGSILHYNDQLKGLNSMYFLDPTWLCDVLSKVLMDPEVTKNIRNGKISLDVVESLFMNDPRFPNELIDQCVQLLQRFEIALKVDAGKKLFIPSTLARNPGIELHQQHNPGKDVSRLYQLAFIPNGFWSRLLPRIMSQLELLSEDWIFRNSSTIRNVQRQIRNRTMYRAPSSGNSQGLKIESKNIVYWEDGMCLLPQDKEKGYFMLQTVSIPRDGYNTSGVLVTVHSNNDDYSIMGTIVDSIDDVLNDHFPGLMDYDSLTGQPRIQRFAVCPVCYHSLSTMSFLPTNLDHFTVEHCARLLLSTDSIVCKTGVRVSLQQLVPELLMEELPKKFLLVKEKLTVFTEVFLGRGVAGSVFKGKYGDQEMAIKFYHGAPDVISGRKLLSSGSKDSSYYTGEKAGKKSISVEKGIKQIAEEQKSSNSDTDEDESHLTDYKNIDNITKSFDMDEAKSIKAWRAFMEMRQEVAVTSKLRHPCVISFLGICVRPQLLMCLELAPLGSLRDVLDSQIEGREPFNKYRDQDKIFLPVFVKDLSYKIVWQMAKGLEYLHKHGILYRDLKSDNVLVTSLELDAFVNIKLSDLGISKINTSGSAVGLVGTPGYQAPEIIEGLAYDEKVDIFSFAMVIHEILSGERPYVEYKNLAQISRAMRFESKRPSLKDYNIDARFPALEDLMMKCWQNEASCRPKASEITSPDYLRSIQFVCQHKVFSTPDNVLHQRIDCVAPVTELETQTKQLWLWEGSGDGRCYHIIDMTTCRYQVYKEWLPGAKVTCMTKIGKEVWVGNESEQIEIFGQKSHGNPTKVKTISKLGSKPTNILYLEEDNKKQKKVYVSLSNGKLKIYKSSEKKERFVPPSSPRSSSRISDDWQFAKTLHLSRGSKAASTMAFIPVKGELWIGCGNEIVIVNDSTELVEQRIALSHAQRYLRSHRDFRVAEVVYDNGSVWVLVDDSSIILEYDAEMGILIHVIDCDAQNPLGMAISNYVSEPSGGPEKSLKDGLLSNSDSSSGESLNDDELDRWIDSGSDPEDTCGKKRQSTQVDSKSGKVLYSRDSEEPPPLPPKTGKSTSETLKRTSADYKKPPKKLNEVTSNRTSISEEGVHKNSGSAMNQDLRGPKLQALSSQCTPPLPPKIKESRNSPGERRSCSSSLPSQPPAVPLRTFLKAQTLPAGIVSSQNSAYLDSTTISSMICVGDSLWIGRKCGDIVVVNIKSNSSLNYEHGRVMACMKPKYSEEETFDTEYKTETLLLVGSLVISLANEDDSSTKIMAWEAYDTHDVYKVQNYWSMKPEKKRTSMDEDVETEILED